MGRYFELVGVESANTLDLEREHEWKQKCTGKGGIPGLPVVFSMEYQVSHLSWYVAIPIHLQLDLLTNSMSFFWIAEHLFLILISFDRNKAFDAEINAIFPQWRKDTSQPNTSL